MQNALTVWRNGRALGTLTSTRTGLRFVYEPIEVERIGLGIPVVSASMPTSLRSYANRACQPFFDGLLPEGEARRIIAYDLGVAESDTYGLLRALGRDCAGALTIIPKGQLPPRSLPVDALQQLDADEIDQRVANLRFQPLGVDADVRVSLGGVQEKLLLTKRSDGSWALPSAEVASTHILKPEISGLDGSVHNEAVCLAFALHLGVRAASTAIESFGRRDVLVVQRFDRQISPNQTVRRAHQETACQALAVPVASTARKYQDAGGPSLRAIAALLRKWGTTSDLEELLCQLTVNMVVGNADAHAMNTSIVLNNDGTIELSPMYDVFSTVAYPQLSKTVGMFVDGEKDIGLIGRAHLVREAIGWGLDRECAYEIVGRICRQAAEAMESALSAVDGVSLSLSGHLRQRVIEFT
jgi:serine/threonine-protein kinase HipA